MLLLGGSSSCLTRACLGSACCCNAGRLWKHIPACGLDKW